MVGGSLRELQLFPPLKLVAMILLKVVKHKQSNKKSDVAGLIRALGIMLSEWCCSISIVEVQILSREITNLSAQKFNSNTVG